MGLARTLAVTLTGLAGHIVEVEAHAAQGLPGFTLVGLPDAAVRESRERVRAALSTCGVTWGEQRLTVNLSPADLRKTGTGLDLALALAVLGARGQLGRSAAGLLGRTVYIGELDIIALEPAHAHREPSSAPLGAPGEAWPGPRLVIVEVKTRSSLRQGPPAAAVDARKLARLRALAAAWISTHEGPHAGLRLDVVSILLREQRPALLRHHRAVGTSWG